MRLSPVYPISTLLLALSPTLASAADALDPDAESAAIGPELTVIDRQLETNGNKLDFDGPLLGVGGYYQASHPFRVEGRLLGGSLDFESEDGSIDENESGLYGELRATTGMEMGDKARLYTGLGGEYLESDLDDVDYESWSAYIPIGYSSAKSMSSKWDAMVTIEGRLLVDGVEEFSASGSSSIADADFDRSGGVGAMFSATFRNVDQGIELEPYLQAMRPDDTDRENGLRFEDLESVSGGLRFRKVF